MKKDLLHLLERSFLMLQPRAAEGIDPPFLLFSEQNSDDKPTIRAGRRRRAEQPSGGRERAEAPQRRDTDQRPAPGMGGYGGASGDVPQSARPPIPTGGLPFGKKSGMSMILLLIIICVFFAIQQMGGGGILQPAPVQPAYQQPTEPFSVLPVGQPTSAPLQAPTKTPAAASHPVAAPPSASIVGQKWLVMLYQDADDKVLEQDIYIDLNEAEKVGSSERVTIVAQFDRYRGGYQGDGDWTTARRYLIQKDSDLTRVRSELISDLGEVNMSDPSTLIDFVDWAVKSYPADRYALILSDHGMGWPGGWSDSDSAQRSRLAVPLANRLGDQLYLNEIDEALQQILQRTGLQKLDFIGMDACLMAQLEVFTALAPYAEVAVASEEVEPAVGWAYTSFLSQLSANPDLTPSELGRQVVESYIKEDQRIIDTQARSEMLRGMGGMFGLFGEPSPQALISQMGQDSTLSAVDLTAIPALNEELNRFAYTLQDSSQPLVARARAYAQSFTSIFGSNIPPSYIDLGHFAYLLRKESNDQKVIKGAELLLTAIDKAVIAEKHGPKKPGATGIAIYFPNSQVYNTAEAGPRSYTALANRFAKVSLWDDFMAFHYTNRVFEPADTAAVIPAAAVRAPGAGKITLSPIVLDSPTAAPGKPVLLSTDVKGENISYIYLFVGYLDRVSNSIYIADTDFLESSDTREVNGVYYPDWGDGSEFTLEFEWEPIVFAIDDGQKRVSALFNPVSYGADYEEAVYSVEGIYIYGDSGETRRARLYFTNGALRQVVGFTGDEAAGSPREIIPTTGDRFTILETWMDIDANGRATKVEQQGKTLTFGSETFKYVELDAAAGVYLVGFIAEDLDGNSYPVYTKVTVQ